jgi:hypothetical protein
VIYYKAVPGSTTKYNYVEAGKAHSVPALITVDSVVANSKRTWKRVVHATGVRWALEISDAESHAQLFPIYQDTQSNILGPGSRLPIIHPITISLSSPECRVYLHVVCEEGSSATFNKIVKVLKLISAFDAKYE